MEQNTLALCILLPKFLDLLDTLTVIVEVTSMTGKVSLGTHLIFE
jgi:hypothetical protein